jgi:hypothetical protein
MTISMSRYRATQVILTSLSWLAITTASGAPPVVLKQGPCPSGYHTSGHYCVGTADAPLAVLKNGPCPSHYHTSGNYCLGAKEAPVAVPKVGPCPSGYRSSGNYCLGQ